MGTPRTESVAQMVSTDSEHTDASVYNIMYRHARTLERELAEKELEIAELKNHAAIGRRVKAMITDGPFDLRDSPKSFMSNCEALLRAAKEEA